MQFYRENWFNVGGVLFVALTFVMALAANSLDHIQVILIYSFMALLVHQYEEYAAPGGFPSIFNIALSGEKAVPERYPLNTNQVLVTNVYIAYPFYLAAIVFPNLIWLGVAQVVFGTLQVIIHGIVINRRLGTFYNPGLASAVFLHVPICVYYIWYVSSHGLAAPSDYVIGVIATLVAALVAIIIPIRLLSSKTSPYPFPERMFYGYAKEKLVRMRNS